MNEPVAFALFTYIEGTWPQAIGLYKILFYFEAHVHESTRVNPCVCVCETCFRSGR